MDLIYKQANKPPVSQYHACVAWGIAGVEAEEAKFPFPLMLALPAETQLQPSLVQDSISRDAWFVQVSFWFHLPSGIS